MVAIDLGFKELVSPVNKFISLVETTEGDFFSTVTDIERGFISTVKEGVSVIRDIEGNVFDTIQLAELAGSRIFRDAEEYLAIGATDVTRGVVSTVKDVNRTWAAVIDNISDDAAKVILQSQQNGFNLFFFLFAITSVSSLGLFVLYKKEIDEMIRLGITSTDEIIKKLIKEGDFKNLPSIKILNLI